MYSLDINFLNDRNIVQGPDPTRQKVESTESKLPMVLGVAVGLLLPAGVGLLWFLLQGRIADVEQRLADLNTKLEGIKAQEGKIASINKETQAISSETQALATVFNQLTPWSALLQDIRDRVPPGVQVLSIQQTEPEGAAASASPDPNNPQPIATSKIEISGRARSFNEVNDFVLTLQRSILLQKDQTQLITAELKDNPIQLELPPNLTQAGEPPKLPKIVDYKIKTYVSDAPAAELLREWERKGAVGLATRLRTLKKTGVIQP